MLLLDDIAAIESEAAQISALGSYDLGVKEGRAAALREVAEAVERIGVTQLPEAKEPADAFFYAFEECRAEVLAILTEATGASE